MPAVAPQPRTKRGPRPNYSGVSDFSDAAEKRRVMNVPAPLEGLYEWKFKPTRNLRSLQQNRWYWGCIVTPFYEFLHGQDYDINSTEAAHELLKSKFLHVPVVNLVTGDIIAERTQSTTELTTAEFSDYCERARAWLLDMFGIVTMDPN